MGRGRASQGNGWYGLSLRMGDGPPAGAASLDVTLTSKSPLFIRWFRRSGAGRRRLSGRGRRARRRGAFDALDPERAGAELARQEADEQPVEVAADGRGRVDGDGTAAGVERVRAV